MLYVNAWAAKSVRSGTLLQPARISLREQMTESRQYSLLVLFIFFIISNSLKLHVLAFRKTMWVRNERNRAWLFSRGGATWVVGFLEVEIAAAHDPRAAVS